MLDLIGISKPDVPSDKYVFMPSAEASWALALGAPLPQLPLVAPGVLV
jgi:hypothetical protein